MRSRSVLSLAILLVLFAVVRSPPTGAADNRFALSDSDSVFLHHIDLYDEDNNKITPDSQKPYSSLMTCGRCHDYETISHGWHFNAFLPNTNDGRSGEPWIYTDERTGTQLPLSYRDYQNLFHPNELGITPWEMTRQFGDRIPGGGLATGEPAQTDASTDETATDETAAVEAKTDEADATEGEADKTEADQKTTVSDRWKLSGALRIDCLTCHASEGSYDFNARREQIKDENFAWAATAGLRLGSIDGKVSRIKAGSDPESEAVLSKLPKVDYDERKFAADGTVFIDLLRKPSNNACYQCHSQRSVGPNGIESRWIHDSDVHLRAGMLCTDCHRNGIDHHIVRGYQDESDSYDNPHTRQAMSTLSCVGCHMGPTAQDAPDTDGDDAALSADIRSRSGRLGAPMPLHAGLPAIHFELLSCTTCHSGPIPSAESKGMLTSFAHSLGEKTHRTGRELPQITAPVFGLGEDGKIYPQRAVWPAFWGTVTDGELKPIDPSKVYELTRRSLRVRRNFVEELVMPEPSRTERTEILGAERAAATNEELTAEERAKLEAFSREAGQKLFNEKVSTALSDLEKELQSETVVYVSSGLIYKHNEDATELVQMDKSELKNPQSVEMVRWPLAHNVRPAGWSLGVNGCLECHASGSAIFDSMVQSIGPGPDHEAAITMATLRGSSANQVLVWNQLFAGRTMFKFIIAGSLIVLLIVLLIGVGAVSSRLMSRAPKSPHA